MMTSTTIKQPLEALFDMPDLSSLAELDAKGKTQQDERVKQDNKYRYEADRKDIFYCAQKSPDEELTLDNLAAFSLTFIKDDVSLEDIAKMRYHDLVKSSIYGFYNFEGSEVLGTFYQGLISTAMLFTGLPRNSYQKPVRLWFKSGNMGLSNSEIQSTRIMTEKSEGQAPMLVLDRLSGIENYLEAIKQTVQKDVVEMSEDGSLTLKWAYFVAPEMAMCLLGAAKGLELIAEKAGLPEDRKEHALSIAKQAYEMSGLSGKLYVASKLLQLGEPKALRFVQIPEAQYADFLGYLNRRND